MKATGKCERSASSTETSAMNGWTAGRPQAPAGHGRDPEEARGRENDVALVDVVDAMFAATGAFLAEIPTIRA